MLGIEIINKCNFNCYFCDSQYVTDHKVMDNKTFFDIVNQAKEINIKYLDLTPIDGELFMDKHFIEKLEYVLPNFKVFFHTNFSLCTPEIQDKLKVLQNKYDLKITVSDYYSEGIEAYKTLTRSDDKNYNNYTNNLAYANTIDLVLHLSYRGLNYNFTLDDTYVVNTKRSGICSLQYIPRVSMNGDVDYCLCGEGNLTDKNELLIGNIYETSLKEVYYSKKRLDIFQNQAKGIYNKSCTNCDLFETNTVTLNTLKHYKEMRK